jgi:hypothetical protein
MKAEEIKSSCEEMYKQIRDAEAKLKELRSVCKHPNTFEGNYSWRVGSIQPAIICSDCGSLMKFTTSQLLDEFEKEAK